jgi:hypothetical protein
MPRLCKSNSEPLDFCQGHFPSLEVARSVYGDVAEHGEGPDDRGNCFEYDCDHPAYAETDYVCFECGKKLEDKDDWID